MMTEYTDVATIRATAQRAKDEGLGVTERQIRTWVKQGHLRHTMVGRKALVFWPNLLRFLENGDIFPPTGSGGTRSQTSRLEEEIDSETA